MTQGDKELRRTEEPVPEGAPALKRIMELLRDEASRILASSWPPSLQEEQLLSPVVKYLVAHSNQLQMCTETQVCHNLSIPRTMARKAMQALEAYGVIKPVADFGTVKPYKVLQLDIAVKSALVALVPEEMRLLFGVRDAKDFGIDGKSYRTYVSAEDGTRWLPPLDAAASFFSSIVSESRIGLPPGSSEVTAYQVDLVFLGRLLREIAQWPLTGDDLLLIEKGGEMGKELALEDYLDARRRLTERYCDIFSSIAERMITDGPVQPPGLAYMAEVLTSCINASRAFGVSRSRQERCENLIKRIGEEEDRSHKQAPETGQN